MSFASWYTPVGIVLASLKFLYHMIAVTPG